MKRTYFMTVIVRNFEISVCFLMSTQSSIPPGYVNKVPVCLAVINAGRVHLRRVAGKTVRFHMVGDAP